MGWSDAPEVVPTGKWASAPAVSASEAPQYAPNGVPMNAAAKAEITAKAKAGTLGQIRQALRAAKP